MVIQIHIYKNVQKFEKGIKRLILQKSGVLLMFLPHFDANNC